MIDDGYINACFFKCYNKFDSSGKGKKTYVEMKKLLTEFKENNGNKFDIGISNKAELLLIMLDFSIDGVGINDIVKEIKWDGKFNGLKEYIDTQIEMPYVEAYSKTMNKRLTLTRNDLLQERVNKKYADFLNKSTAGEFNTRSEQTEAWRKLNIEIYKSIKENDRISTEFETKSFSTSQKAENNMSIVANNFIDRCNFTNKIPSGFDLIDSRVLRGGFEKTRLYCIGGAAKSGKSTFLNNIFIKAGQVDYSQRAGSDGKPKIFVFITLENAIDELFARCYSNIFQKEEHEVLHDLKTNKDNMLKTFGNRFEESNNIAAFKEYPSNAFSTEDLEVYLENLLQQHSEEWETECTIGAVYIDYLNLMSKGGDDDWKGLGNIATGLKNLAKYGVLNTSKELVTFPIITATQLRRESKPIEKASDMDVNQVGESIRIVQVVDSMMLLSISPKDKNMVLFNSGRQRNGEGGYCLNIKVKFSTYSFLSCVEEFAEAPKIDTVNLKIPKSTKTATKPVLFDFGDDIL